MYLKRLKVRNFKSFAGATEIPFQPGFTGIAGPNGMGKSNISDAILFVLGPTSSKALRADRLTHLLFNGGATKKASTDCEVSLVFDNADHALPVASDEVEVTRYVKLTPSDPDGYYSYFYVNGKRTTQAEIDSLLAHGRLSGDGYNLVQQGDVNRIVSMGPVPRRGLVERLAGISQYDDELARAQTKRTDLDTNLGQIRTLLGEIRSRLGSLEGQRLQAIQYKQLQDEKRQSEARLARADLLLCRQEVNAAEAARGRLEAEIEEIQTEITQLTSQRESLTEKMDAIEREIARRGGAQGEALKTQLDGQRLDFARKEQEWKGAQERLEELTVRRTELETAIASAEKELATLEKKEKEVAGRHGTLDEELRSHSQALKSASGDADQASGKLAELRKKILAQEEQRARLQTEWESIVQELEAARAAADSAERDRATAEDDEKTRALELKDLELRIRPGKGSGEGGQDLPALQDQLHQTKAKEKQLAERAEALKIEVLELNRRYSALDARMKTRAEGGNRSNSLATVDYLLSLRNLGKVAGIRGTVEELARYEANHRTALTVAAGNRFQAIIVENDRVAEECIQLLRSEKRGRATFLPLNKMLPGRPRGKSLIVSQSGGAVGFASDLVTFDEELRPAFWYVFGETVVMKELAAARENMGGVRLVTLQGDLIEATGAMTGGFLDTGDRGKGADTAVELKRLGDELQVKSRLEADTRTELTRVTDELRAIVEELARRTAEAQASGATTKLLESQLGQAKDHLATARRRVQELGTAYDSASARQAAAERRQKELEGQRSQLEQLLTQLNEQFHSMLPQSTSRRIRTLQEGQERATQELMEVTKELEGLRAQIQAAQTALALQRTELEQESTRAKELGRQIKELEKGKLAAQEELDKLRQLEAESLKAVQGQAEERKRLETDRLRLAEKLAQQSTTLATRQTMDQSEAIRLAQAQKKLGDLEEAARAFPDEAEEGATEAVPIEELRKRISILAAQIEAMGSVNLRALEEYDSEKGRLDGFEAEVARLSTEKEQLLGLVGEIETKKKQKLVTVVDAVNTAYRQIYGELSAGGEGEIALENPDDPLAGGLRISARPIGKNVQRLEQLSGGEKSLASLAFVFALQRYDPSPLYVFDEVDMSLDGVNAENVGRLLRRNAERAQFIVISLRKVTLKFAHRLFGVTMHGDGRSRVVSLGLEEIIDVDDREHERAGTVAPRVVAPQAAA